MFYTNYVRYCEMLGKTPYQVASEIGVKSTATIAGWKAGANPRTTVVSNLLSYLKENGIDVTVPELFAEDDSDEDVMELRDYLRNRPEGKILFDASRDAPASALLEAAALIMRYKETNRAD